MKRVLLLAVVMLVVLWSVETVRAGRVAIWNVYTEPNQPTNRDSISIVVSGTGTSSGAWIIDSNFQVEGTSLELDISVGLGPYGKPSVWSHSEVIGMLPAHSYDLTVRAYYDSELSDTYLTSFTVVPGPLIDADIEIEPKTLNLQSKGKWLTCHIWLPEDYNVADIEPNSVRLENEPNDIYAEWIWFEEQEELAMAKFDRSEVQEMLVEREELGDVELTVSGELVDGSIFEGTDTIRVVDKGGKKK